MRALGYTVIPASFRSFGQRYRLPLALCGNLALCAAILVACTGDNNSPTSPSNSATGDTPASMAITVTSTPSTGDVKEGGTRQYAIQVKNGAGTVLPSLTTATWSVSNTNTATITQSGLATCKAAPAGTAAVTVTATGPTGSSYASLSATTSLQCVP